MVGGHPGGVIRATFGLVEFDDGTVNEVPPQKIVFCDNKVQEYAFKEAL